MSLVSPSLDPSNSDLSQLFGTDGIRGRVGEYPITPEMCLHIARVVGHVVRKQGGRTVLIGKDTRISGYMLESVLEAGFIASGVNVGLLGVMPTPGVALATRETSADLGVAISASHNPFYDNGIKFFDQNGLKLSDEIEAEIVSQMKESFDIVEPDDLGKATRPRIARQKYFDFCRNSVNGGSIDLKGLRIVLDCAHGATYAIAPAVFEQLGAEIHTIGTSPDGKNINLNCGSTNPESVQREVVRVKADLGIALDGDGDRVLLVDRYGNLLDGDHILYALAKWNHLKVKPIGGVVGTVMSNFGLEIALRDLGIPFQRTDVGDRNVQAKMIELGWKLGGETSGHILCHDLTPTGDGIVSALQLLLACQHCGWTLDEIVRDLNLYPQVQVNVDVANPRKSQACEAAQGVVAQLGATVREAHRIVVRPSGTEPVVRVMVEGEDPSSAAEIAQNCARAISHAG